MIVCAQSPGAELTLQVPGGGLGQRDGFAQIFLLGSDGGHARGWLALVQRGLVVLDAPAISSSLRGGRAFACRRRGSTR